METQTSDTFSQKQKPVVRPMTGNTGVEVSGLELRQGDGADIRFIKDLLHKHCVVAFRDQFLTPTEQMRLGPMFGEMMNTPLIEINTDWPDLYRIENVGKANVRTEQWHSDASFSPRPPSYSMLSAKVVPEAAGDTLFVNQYVAYERLSDRFKRLLRGLRIVHVRPDKSHDPSTWPRAVHPAVRTIPETGRRALFFNALMGCYEIEGMTLTESAAVLEFLDKHMGNGAIDYTYRHRWLPGDVVMWDNRSTRHFAVHDYGNAERTLFRLMFSGEVPFEAPYED